MTMPQLQAWDRTRTTGPAAAIPGLVFCGLLICGTLQAAVTGQQLAEQAGASLLGTRAPPLVLQTIAGERIDLGALAGHKAVYLKFWATWCVPCRQQMPHFEHAFEAARPNMVVVAVNSGFNDSVEEVQAYRRAFHLQMPMVVDDGAAAAAFHLRVTPQHVVIGRDGRIEYIGHLADARLDAALRHAAQEGPAGAEPTARAPDRPTTPAAPTSSAPQLAGAAASPGALRSLSGTDLPIVDPEHRRPTVLVFFTPWCESYLAHSRPAQAAACRQARAQVARLATDPRARWIGISSGLWVTREDVEEYGRQLPPTMALALDDTGHLFRAYRVAHVPDAIVLDGNGQVTARLDAHQLGTPEALQESLAKLAPAP